MTSWDELRAALDGVAARGEAIRVWWRDDDAGRDHPALTRLLELAERHDLPLALAVVPMWLDANTQARIAASPNATVLQHGFAHADHAAPEGRSIELGGRDPGPSSASWQRPGHARGCVRLCLPGGAGAALEPAGHRPGRAPDRLRVRRPVHLRPARRRQGRAGPGQVNTHLDPVDWRGTRLFVGETAALTRLVAVLDAEEPIGILSHHLAMDEAGWAFLDRLLGCSPRIRARGSTRCASC